MRYIGPVAIPDAFQASTNTTGERRERMTTTAGAILEFANFLGRARLARFKKVISRPMFVSRSSSSFLAVLRISGPPANGRSS